MAIDQVKGRPRVGIIGTGLSGAILAELLNPVCDLVLFERGNEQFERASDVEFTAHQPGWPSFSYGIGGTTNIWSGGLVEMLPGEFTPRWPENIRHELPQYYTAVVRQLYHQSASEAWARRTYQSFSDDVHLTTIYYPHTVFRVPQSQLLRGCDVRPNYQLQELHENSKGVELALSQNGTIKTERLDYVILACGGLNSPIPLLRSGLGGSAVGLNYTDHPTGFVAKISRPHNREVLDVLRAKWHGFEESKAFMKIRDRQTGLWSAAYLRPAGSIKFKSDPYVGWFRRTAEPRLVRRVIRKISNLSDVDEVHRIGEYRLGLKLPCRFAYVHVINEQEDSGQGAVTLNSNDRPSLSWQVSDTTIGSIQRNLATLAEFLGAELHLPQQPMVERIHSAAHHSGTCRISSNSADGVVDKNLLVHGAERIYVCDASVLPSTGATNTALTIGALAHRLAKHLTSIFSGN